MTTLADPTRATFFVITSASASSAQARKRRLTPSLTTTLPSPSFPPAPGKNPVLPAAGALLDGLTLVVSPLIALMKDQVDFLQSRGIPAARLDSSLTLDELRNVQAGMLDGTLKIVYVSPERFNNERFLSLSEPDPDRALRG